MTELLEEVPTLHQKNKDEAEKVKSLEEHVKELEETLCMERAEKDNEIVKIINLHSEEKKVHELARSMIFGHQICTHSFGQNTPHSISRKYVLTNQTMRWLSFACFASSRPLKRGCCHVVLS